MAGLQVRGLGAHDPPALAVDTPSELTPFFGIYFTLIRVFFTFQGVFLKLFLGIKDFAVFPPQIGFSLPVLLPCKSLGHCWSRCGICPPTDLHAHPSSCPGSQGGVFPSAYEIWLATSAQMLQPWPPSSPAAQGSSSSAALSLLLFTRTRGEFQELSLPLFSRAWGSFGRKAGCGGFMAQV